MMYMEGLQKLPKVARQSWGWVRISKMLQPLHSHPWGRPLEACDFANVVKGKYFIRILIPSASVYLKSFFPNPFFLSDYSKFPPALTLNKLSSFCPSINK